ncbi:hypothetical protein [Desulfobacula sp.]|uniref:hypothetical protein n=1 Tax=Desulfobacula sp. TaxID=2593537 RepID=UPI002609FA11|nr:hypothetical protein [Desulfobacula sp.]
MIDIFSMFLNGVVGWGVGSILDTITKCFSCGQKDTRRIGNIQSNYIECSNCHRIHNQFTNACDFTINRSTNEIGHALFTPGRYKWEWKKKGFFDGRQYLYIPFDIRIKGMCGRSIIIETELKRYNDSRIITSHSSILNPIYDNSTWTDYWHSFGVGNFKPEDKGIVAVDARIRSEYRDILFEDRRIIKPWK